MSSSTSSSYSKKGDQPLWSSARVSSRRNEESAVPSSSSVAYGSKKQYAGSSASRWADSTVEQSSSVRQKDGSSQRQTSHGNGNNGSSASRWSSSSSSKPRRQSPVTAPSAVKYALPPRPSVSPVSQQPAQKNPVVEQKPQVQEKRALPANVSMQGNPAANIGRELDFMALISSPSRGIQGYEVSSVDGMSREDQDLTLESTQAKYRLYISKRVHDHCKKFPTSLQEYCPSLDLTMPGEEAPKPKAESSVQASARNSLEQILLLVRKLREGMTASHREDEATVEVYHLSLFLSLLTMHKQQLSSTLHRLVLELYTTISPAQPGSSWPSSVSRDFSSLEVSCDISKQLHLFEDSLETRSHTASILLLCNACLSDAKSPPQDEFHTLRYKIMDSQVIEAADQDQNMALANRVYRARKDVDVLAIRNVLVGTSSATPFQKFLVYEIVPRLRASSLQIVKKAYRNAVLPPNEATTEDRWYEQLLLVDPALVK
ncbi:unnamed protein product [Sympodiomycopsis kandeliae]